GLDMCGSVGQELGPFLGLEIPPGMDRMIEAMQRGKKDGQGFYTWTGGKPVKPDVPKGYAPPADLEDRLILPMINEQVACLHYTVLDDAAVADAGVVFGTGFAPFRCGPIQYVRDTDAAVVKPCLETLAQRHGERFDPKPGWDAESL